MLAFLDYLCRNQHYDVGLPRLFLIEPNAIRRPGESGFVVTVTGGVDYLANLDKELVEVFVDYRTQWSPTDALVEPQVRLGDHLLEYRDLVPGQLEIITSR